MEIYNNPSPNPQNEIVLDRSVQEIKTHLHPQNENCFR